MAGQAKGHILIVDDDAALAEMLALHFEDLGHEVSRAFTCAEALARIQEQDPDVILLDQQLPDGQGVGLLPRLVKEDDSPAVIMMTGLADLELAMEAIGLGAVDFVHKPIKLEALNHVLGRVLGQRRIQRRVALMESEPSDGALRLRLVGRSDAMLQVSKDIARIAPTEATVLITGESGTGKELVARAIHARSRRAGPFVAVNSAAIVDTLLESELFGHEKGAFTGAVSRKLGKFELARDGTLFLDEIGELPLAMQASLLRVLQEHCFERVGGTQHIPTNARIIAATNRDLAQETTQRRFRQDLLYRLNVLCIEMPPLRTHVEDIPLLSEALLEKIGRSIHRYPLQITAQALARLQAYHWPGNVRELENVLTQAAVRTPSTILSPDLFLLPDETGASPPIAAQTETLALRSLNQLEAEHVQRVLDHVQGHKGRACEILGISRPALDRKIERYALRISKPGS
jgi:two-component system response regulator AtoC